MSDHYDFGELLRKKRTEKGMTQGQLAAKLGLSVTAISKYESNTASPTFETMRSLAAILNVSMDELYGTEQRFTMSTYGMHEQQIQLLKELAKQFRSKNNAEKGITEEQYTLLGKILSELLK